MQHTVEQVKGQTLSAPFQRLSWADAMERFGCDKPDMRYALELQTVSPALSSSTFRCATCNRKLGADAILLYAPLTTSSKWMHRNALQPVGMLCWSKPLKV